MRDAFKRRGMSLLPGLLALALWYAATANSPRSVFFFGSPGRFLEELWRLTKSGELFLHTGITGAEAFGGFILGNALGATVGLLMWQSPIVFRLLRPYVFALGSAPLFAFAPIIVVWFGTGFAAKVFVAAMATFFLALMQAYKGAEEASSEFAEVVRALGGTKRDVFRKVVVPSAMTWVIAGFHLNIGQALLGAFLGEYISSEAGLGHVILVAGGLYNIPLILVAVTMIVLVSWVLSVVVRAIERPLRSFLVTGL